MNIRIPCFIKILQLPLGMSNLHIIIAYTDQKAEVESPPPPTTEWIKFKESLNFINSAKIIGDEAGGAGTPPPPFIL